MRLLLVSIRRAQLHNQFPDDSDGNTVAMVVVEEAMKGRKKTCILIGRESRERNKKKK